MMDRKEIRISEYIPILILEKMFSDDARQKQINLLVETLTKKYHSGARMIILTIEID